MHACRWVLQVLPKAEMLTAAILKVAAGTPMLAASLDPDAFLMEVSKFLPHAFSASCVAETALYTFCPPLLCRKHMDIDMSKLCRVLTV